MLDWNEYHKELGARIGELAKLSPDTVRGYQTLSAANSKTGKLEEKTRQLISLAVAVTTRCDGCIVVHSDAALKAGATKEEISEALGVAVAMNAGAVAKRYCFFFASTSRRCQRPRKEFACHRSSSCAYISRRGARGRKARCPAKSLLLRTPRQSGRASPGLGSANY
jgi:AhpD family alkylhydroperoxidase